MHRVIERSRGNDSGPVGGLKIPVGPDRIWVQSTESRFKMQTARAYLHGLGLTPKPTGRGRFSREAHAALDTARAKGISFSDDAPKAAPKPKVIKMPKAETVKVDTRGVDPKAVREWAKSAGIEIGARGRIHTDIIARYLSDVPETEQESREGEFDVYAPGAPRVYAEGTTFVGEYTFQGKTFKHVANDRAACKNTGVSIAVCRCNAHEVVNGHGTGHVAVTPVYPKG